MKRLSLVMQDSRDHALVGRAAKSKQVIYVSSAKGSYTASPRGGWGIHASNLAHDKGPHATFTKFEPGYSAGVHTHTSDISIVVIKGAYVYKDEAGEKRLGQATPLRARWPQAQ